jgi:hypothetical protein
MELERTAFHEAGHAVGYIVCGLDLERVTIERHLPFAGRTVLVPGAEMMNVVGHATAALCGAEAVRRWNPERYDWRCGAEGDFLVADEFIDKSVGEIRDLSQYVLRRATISQRVRSDTERLVEDYWSSIQAVARALLATKTLLGSEVKKVFDLSLRARGRSEK